MRKTLAVVVVGAAVLAGAGAALGGQAATNANGDFIDLNVAVTPPVAGTAKAPRGVGVSLDSFLGNRINGNSLADTESLVVRFSKGFKENGLLFPACEIDPEELTVCPKSTKIGTGTGEASVAGSNGAAPTFVPAKITVYNGAPYKSKAPTLIFTASLNGTPATELDFTVDKEARGPYGLAFNNIVFDTGEPAAFLITKFSVTIPDRTITRRVRGKRVKVHLLQAPTTCRKSWKFAQTNVLTGSGALTATDSQPCTKR